MRTNETAVLRRVTCARCGAAFTCGLGGECWCAAEPYRFQMPKDGEDCLCQNCLAAAARVAG
jgi:hypothetical protein